MLDEHADLVRDVLPTRNQVDGVGVARRDRQRALLALAAHEDRRTADLQGGGPVDGVVNAVVATLERRSFVAEHGPADPECLLETVHPLGDRWEGDPEAVVLLLEPGGADAQHGPSAREHVEGGDLLGQDGGVAVGHSGDQRPEAGRRRAGGEAAEERVALQHVGIGWSQQGQLVEVVHHPHAVETGALTGGRHAGQGLEQRVVADAGEREVGQLQADADHGSTVAPGTERAAGQGRVHLRFSGGRECR